MTSPSPPLFNEQFQFKDIFFYFSIDVFCTSGGNSTLSNTPFVTQNLSIDLSDISDFKSDMTDTVTTMKVVFESDIVTTTTTATATTTKPSTVLRKEVYPNILFFVGPFIIFLIRIMNF